MKRILTTILAIIMIITMAVPAFADDVTPIESAPESTTSQIQTIKPVIKVEGYSYTKIKVSWDKIDGVDGYKVYRASKKAGKYSLIKTVTNPATTSYVNTGRTCGKTYYYKVKGFKKIGGKTIHTKYSDVKSAYARPSRVVVSKVTCPDFLEVKLHWNKVAGASGYQIYRSEKGKNNWKKCDYINDRFYWKYSKKNLTASNMLSTSNGDAYKDWQYKIRAYRIVNGKKIYGAFSKPAEWIPDWTIDEIYEELWKYGEHFEFPVYEWDGEKMHPMKDGSTYHLMHVTGYSESIEGEEGYVYTNPKNGNTAIPKDYIRATEKNTSWNAGWPMYIFKYTKKSSILKDIKPLIKENLLVFADRTPVYWDSDYNEWGPDGTSMFTIYIKKYKNNCYKVWLLYR